MSTYGLLKTHTVKELRQVCKFYDIPYKSNMRKDELIDLLLQELWMESSPVDDPVVDTANESVEEIQKSVRIRRLEELNK